MPKSQPTDSEHRQHFAWSQACRQLHRRGGGERQADQLAQQAVAQMKSSLAEMASMGHVVVTVGTHHALGHATIVPMACLDSKHQHKEAQQQAGTMLTICVTMGIFHRWQR